MSGTLAQCSPQVTMACTPTPYVVTRSMVPTFAPETSLKSILYTHTTPYVPSTWLDTLFTSNLLTSFPNLVHDITYGSPIGNLPALSKCFLPPKLSSANTLPYIIDQELLDEVSAWHMSGPFTLEQASIIFGAPFCSSPMGLVKKVPGDGQWRMIRPLLKQDNEGQSTNGWVDSDEFPAIYFTAS